MFQFHAFIPRIASYVSVALTTGYCGMSLAMCAAHIARFIPGNTLAVTDRHKEDQQQ